MNDKVDIVISGGGVAGLIAACLFGSAGHKTLCLDPSPPVTDRDAKGADLRSTAFLQPSLRILELAGLWSRLSAHATELQIMRIVDADDHGEVRTTRNFVASDISEMPFGWNLPNWLIRRELLARISELNNVEFRPGVSTRRLVSREKHAKIWLSDGSAIDADLIIAADGRNSGLREAAGIAVKTTRYGQKALAFAVTHPIPHANISTETHRTGGPFTLVPLPDYDGKPSSAVVWMENGAEAQRLMALDVPSFETEMSERSCFVNGPLTLASQRSVWPIISQIAERFSAGRLALIGEAAHVVPPIGAQGLNMSLADLGALIDLSRDHPLGSHAMMDAYDKARHRETQARVMGIDLLNRASMSENRWLRELRGQTIGLIHDVKPVRSALMKLGLGAR